VLFFRIFEIAFFGAKPPEGHGHHEGEEAELKEERHPEIPNWTGTSSLLVASAFVILLGIFNGKVVELIRVALEDLTVVAQRF
jgi:formate hydrogenlyase subunit 3/multisubunit Na+/H+ antiporter MnhD subunit